MKLVVPCGGGRRVTLLPIWGIHPSCSNRLGGVINHLALEWVFCNKMIHSEIALRILAHLTRCQALFVHYWTKYFAIGGISARLASILNPLWLSPTGWFLPLYDRQRIIFRLRLKSFILLFWHLFTLIVEYVDVTDRVEILHDLRVVRTFLLVLLVRVARFLTSALIRIIGRRF